MGNLIGVCCGKGRKVDVTQVVGFALQKACIGLRVLAQPATNPPEIWVEILDMFFKEGGYVTFDPQEFQVEGLIVKLRIEITGTKAEIAREVAVRSDLKRWIG